MLTKVFEKICNNSGLFSYFIKYCLQKLSLIINFSSHFLVKTNSTKRPNYAYCLYHSANLAKKLNYKSFSIIEFGVAGGKGLLFLEDFAKKIEKDFDIKIQIYGFDLGSGLSTPVDYKDLKYWFNEGFYKMNEDQLKKKLKKSKILIGDVKDTIKDFFENYDPSPIGAIFHDLDYYYSTVNSFKIFENDNKYYLPRIFNYFDDINGTELEMYNDLTGELLAISEFNKKHKMKKILLNKNLIYFNNEIWRGQIYHFHDFNHPNYNKYIGGAEQIELNKNLKLN
tara:strand:- start:399 stop:1244 length:846 start_codon:yes stop_codon:yes gene_type:complete